MNAALADCLVLTRQHLAHGQVKVVQHFAAQGRVRINLQELQQVLINLIVNAVQAMPEGGTLTLETHDRDAHADARGVRIVVRDTGGGIRAEDMARLFDPFFTTKPIGRGTGKGLSIAHSVIVDKHDCRISVESHVGHGSTFIIELSVKPEEQL